MSVFDQRPAPWTSTKPVLTVVRLDVRVRPSAGRSAVTGYESSVLRVDVAAPATKNRANAELVRLLAKELGVGRSSVSIVRGLGARVKVVEVDVPQVRVDSWLASRLRVPRQPGDDDALENLEEKHRDDRRDVEHP